MFRIGLLTLVALMLQIQPVYAGPQKLVYDGRLLDALGNPLIESHDIRFSLWMGGDANEEIFDETGKIKEASTGFAGWEEVHTITPDANGYFEVYLGSSDAGFLDFSTLSTAQMDQLHLQVEVKRSDEPDTAYEILDSNNGSDSEDRSAFTSVPFAINASLLDGRSIGIYEGDIPVLGPGDALAPSMIPGATTSSFFNLDIDGSEEAEIALVFGQELGKIRYDVVGKYFEFDDDVVFKGDITVEGLINNVDITQIGDSRLKVSQGASALGIDIAEGYYRLGGAPMHYSGGTDIAVTDDETNYVYLDAGGLTVSITGYPTSSSFIGLATVVAEGGAITSITDNRIASADDREKSVEAVFHPEYANATYQADGTDNVGRLHVTHDDTNTKNFYQWASTRDTMQDYDVVLAYTLPAGFTGWAANPISIAYRTSTTKLEDNQLDISIKDTNGVPVTLSGDSTDLMSATWANADIAFSGAPTWNAGQDIVIKIKLHSKSLSQSHLGSVTIRYTELENF